MRRFRKALLPVLLLLAVAVGGCSMVSFGADKNPAHETELAKGRKTKLVFWTFNKLHETFFARMADKWNDLHPDEPIELDSVTLPFDALHYKLQAALKSGRGMPDLADIESSRFADFVVGEPELASLNDIIEPELGHLARERVDIYAKGGFYYGIDYHVGAAVMYYNKEIMAKAGVDPDGIRTWADYKEAGRKVVAATGIPMTTIESKDVLSFWTFVRQQKSDWTGPKDEVTLDSAAAQRALVYLQDLVKEKIAVPAPDGSHHAGAYFRFMNKGGAASVWMPLWYMGRFLDFMPDLKGKMIVKPLPAWEEGGFRSAAMGGTASVVSKRSKHRELATRFLAFAKLSKEGNIEIWRQLGFDPIRTDIWDEPDVMADNAFTDYFGKTIRDTFLDISDEIAPVRFGVHTPAVTLAVKNGVMFRTMINLEDPVQVLKEAENELRE